MSLKKSKHGIQMSPDLIELPILLFDDGVLFSGSVTGLQTQLNILYSTAKRLDVVVSLDNSNIVVFRNRGQLALREELFLGDQALDIVNKYKYLGIYLTTRLTFSRSHLP